MDQSDSCNIIRPLYPTFNALSFWFPLFISCSDALLEPFSFLFTLVLKLLKYDNCLFWILSEITRQTPNISRGKPSVTRTLHSARLYSKTALHNCRSKVYKRTNWHGKKSFGLRNNVLLNCSVFVNLHYLVNKIDITVAYINCNISAKVNRFT